MDEFKNYMVNVKGKNVEKLIEKINKDAEVINEK